MTLRRTLVGERLNKPSAAQIRRKIRQSQTVDNFQMKPGYIYTVVRAISARINQNWDGWPADELKKSAHTFVGKPVFVNHENYDPAEARGVVVASRYVENGKDKFIEVVQEIDAQRFPKLAHEIRTGGLDSVSMGAEAAFTICSYCKHKATDESDMCDHVKYHKGEKLRKFNRRTGKTEDVLIYESCHKLSFFELSYVFEPADETAVASKVLVASKKQASEEFYREWECGHCGADNEGDECRDCGAPFGGVYTDEEPGNWNPEDDPSDPRKFGAAVLKAAGYEHSRPPTVQNNYPWRRPRNKVPSDKFDRFRGQPEPGDSPDSDLEEVDPFDPRSYQARVLKAAGFVKEAPFAGYKDFDACVAANQDKSDPEAYCGSIKHKVEDKKASFEERVAAAMLNDCPPGQPCDKAPGLDLEEMSKSTVTTPPTPLSEGTGTATGTPASATDTSDVSGGGSTPGGGSGAGEGLQPGAQALNDLLMERYPGSNIGGVREDSMPYHPEGRALDYMTTDPERAQEVIDLAFQNGAEHVIWDNKLWYPGGKTAPYSGDNPHTDHTHINFARGYKPPAMSQDIKTASRTAGATEDYEAWKAQVESGEVVPEKGVPIPQRLRNPNMDRWRKRQRQRATPLLGSKEREFESRVLATAGYRLAKEDDEDDDRTRPNDQTTPNAPGKRDPGSHPEPPGTQGTFTQNPDQQGADPGPTNPDPGAGPGRAALEDWQLPGGTNPTDPNNLAMPFAQSQIGQYAPTLDRTVTTEDVSNQANQGRIDAWNTANPTNVFDPEMKYDPASMERGVQHVFTKPGDPGAVPPPPAAGAPPPPASTTGPTTPGEASDVMAQVGLDTPTVPPIPQAPAPPGPEALAQPPAPTPEPHVGHRRTASFERRVLRTAFGETEAPFPVDTLREEGSAPEDESDDFHHYVDPPDGLRDPNLDQAGQLDRGAQGPEQGVGDPEANPEDDMSNDQNYMVLKIPMPGVAPPGPMQPPPQPGQPMPPQIPAPPQGQPPGIPMQNFASRTLRAAGYEDVTLENGRGVSQTSRKPRKGQTMGRSKANLAERGRVASRGRRQHFAEGPYTDGGPYGRNDEGEKQETFITEVPPAEHVEMPADDEPNISNTKDNLVAAVQQGRAQLLRDAKALAAYQARQGSRHQGEALVDPPLVNPSVQDSEAEALTGDNFESLALDDKRTDPRQAAKQAEDSLRAFQAFDQWLHKATGRQARSHTAANIRRAADEWAKRARADVRVLFPALGIVLRQARKIETQQAKTKGAKMRKRADEKLEVAAPDERVDVEAPVDNVTDAEAQESQFDLSDFADNAGDSLADPDLSTDSQFWGPGEGSKKKSQKTTQRKPSPAGGILAVRAAEAYINAGLERPESKYQLAGLFENMNKGTVQRDIALLERVAQIQSQKRQKVASGRTRGAASPLPQGLTNGGTRRSAAVQRTAANDPINDALLFD